VIDPIRLGTNAEMDQINEVLGLGVPQQGSDVQDALAGNHQEICKVIDRSKKSVSY
jgi:hypothetical protein